MSVRRIERKGGARWEVRYREGRRNRSRAFDSKKDAVAFESEVKRRKRLGVLPELNAGEERLADYGQKWWRLHAKPNLAPSTLKSYASVWDLHVLPHLGDHELRQITPEVVANLRAALDAADIGPATVRRALFVLQSVMQLAALQSKVQSNPVRVVEKPRHARRLVRSLTPETVERIRAQRELEVTSGELASGALRGLGGEARRDAAIVDYLELPSTPATVEGVLARAAEDEPEAGAHRTSASLEQSIGRWREEGSDSIRSLCEEVFAEALELFGYEGSAARAGPAAETASG